MRILATLTMLLAMALPSWAATTWPAGTNTPNQTFYGNNNFLGLLQKNGVNVLTNAAYVTNGWPWMTPALFLLSTNNGSGVTNLQSTNFVGTFIDKGTNGANTMPAVQANGLVAGGGPAITITTNGSVGIGVSPTYKFETSGGIVCSGNAGYIGATRRDTSALVWQLLSAAGEFSIADVLNGYVSRLTVLPVSGNILIGTSSGSNKLSVNGDIGALAICLTNSVTNVAYIKWNGITASNPPTSGSGTAFLWAATNSAGTAEIFTMDGSGSVKRVGSPSMQTLTPVGTNVTVDFSLGNKFALVCATNVYFVKPLNLTAMQDVMIDVRQNATGAWSVNFDTNYWKFPSSQILTTTTNANSWNLISCIAGQYGTNVAVVQTLNFQ